MSGCGKRAGEKGGAPRIYDNAQFVDASFNEESLTEYLRQAQWVEIIELKKIITEMAKRKGEPITILDIGIGSARVPKHLSGIREIWDMVKSYDGIDNAERCVKMANEAVSEMGLGDKVSVRLLDAANLDEIRKSYDLILLTWFTAGNFFPPDFPFCSYLESGGKYDLSRNDRFQRIFRLAYEHLNPSGEIVIGSAYIDNDSTRKKQEDFYKRGGVRMTIITGKGDSFTATKEGFWSQRFSEDRIRKYLNFVPPENISFIALDTYEFAMMVRIRN